MVSPLGLAFLLGAFGQFSVEERTALPPAGIRLEQWVKDAGLSVAGSVPAGLLQTQLSAGSNPFEVMDIAASPLQSHWSLGERGFRYQKGISGPLCHGKPFWRAELTSVVSEYSWQDRSGKTNLRMQLAWHPELMPILIQAGMFRGQWRGPGSLATAPPQVWTTRPTVWMPLDQQWSTSLEIQGPFLGLPVRIRDLRGEVRLVVPVRSGWVEMGRADGNDGTGIEQKMGGTLIRKGALRQTPNRLSLEVSIKPGPSEYVLESYQESALIGPAKIIWAKDRELPATGYSTLGQDRGWLKVRYDWVRSGTIPWESLTQGSIRVRVADGFTETTVPIAFKEVDLPQSQESDGRGR